MTVSQSVRRPVGRSLLLALASTAAFASVQAVAAEPIDPRLQQAMQRDLGVSAERLPQYLATQRLSLQQGAAAQRALGSTFAGSWIERKADGSFGFVVATSGTGKAARSLGGVEVRNVRHSLLQLERSFAALDAQSNARVPGISRAFEGVQSWRVDPVSNAVVVTVAPGAIGEGVELVALSGADAGAVRFETGEGSPQLTAEVVGGIEYSWPVGSQFGVCSVGFPATKGSVRGFVTAGHCGTVGKNVNVGNRASLIPLGTFANSDFPGTDMAWVTINANHTLSGRVSNYSGGFVSVKGSVEAPIGAALCRSGRTTFYKCGTIRSKNVTVNYREGTVRGLTESNVCTGGGDSGGSWITADGQAQGVTSGGQIPLGAPDNCSVAASSRVTWFQPLKPILSKYGVTLVTH
ncbi:streptogrisin-C precursor [Lysobacter enzymogenes]|uniref:Streptogrisin-C n=1 Tax=Lysobacter enzymogenes TaxID=69 RepID=A0A0S2DF88_LYSEN|nr:S1 family peptidase [Lysobacter enzymogenes]ALN57088.1 streptogrisin-C precursor [Lysobacter enzymogenes]